MYFEYHCGIEKVVALYNKSCFYVLTTEFIHLWWKIPVSPPGETNKKRLCHVRHPENL